jgi:gas vesicle protein
MTFILGLIIGVLVGAAILYVTQKSQLTTLETKLRQTRRELDRTEADFQSQMQQTINYLRQAYDRESTQKNDETVQQYQKEIRNLKHEHQLQLEKLQGKHSSSQTPISNNPSVTQPIIPIGKSLEEDIEFPFDAFNDSFLDLESPRNETEVDIPLAEPIKELQDFVSEKPQPILEDFDLGMDSLTTENAFLDELSFLLSETPKIAFDPSLTKSQSESGRSQPQTVANESPLALPPLEDENRQQDAIFKVLSIQTADRLPQLSEHIYNSDPQVRAAVAETIGKIAESGNIQAKISQCLPILEKLIRDNEVSVRRATIASLSKIRSEKVLPLIRLALKDNDSEVVKLASSAIARFRVYPNSNKPANKNSPTKK